MHSDFRNHPLFKTAEELTSAWLRPGSGEPVTLGQLAVSADGRQAVATATICDALDGVLTRDGTSTTRLALIDLQSGAIEILTEGPGSSSAPAWSPDGRTIAFLSDRNQAHINCLRILDLETRTERATAPVEGFVEYLQWSADGRTILVGVAGYGSDLAGANGAIALDLESGAEERPAWMPIVEGAADATPWRSIWIYDLAADTIRRATQPGINVWQAVWSGERHVAAICSDQPEETWWYSADVRVIDLGNGGTHSLYRPNSQLGWLSASPSGALIAVVEAVCSDRDVVAGDLRIIEVASGKMLRPATLQADVVQLHWRSENELLFAAAQGPESVVGLFDRRTQDCQELWRDSERTPSGAMFSQIAPLGRRPGDVLFQVEGFFQPPALIAVENGRERKICDLGSPATDGVVRHLGTASDFRWTAPDGLPIHGWIITPPGDGPYPVIMQIHGGPVWHARPQYIGRSAFAQMALRAGYALFQPNVRGSSGRGQMFAREVAGDMGGTDTYDYLSGLDALEAAGIADPKRIAVTGVSYGGYMSSWLITQDQRFAAAAPVAPITDWVSQHWTCNVPSWCESFLDDRPDNATGKYFSRSPVHHADRVVTPTLNICGALDKITPAGQALEFHRALRAAGVESILLTYPLDGHGVRHMPAIFDYTARLMAFFSEHLAARSG